MWYLIVSACAFVLGYVYGRHRAIIDLDGLCINQYVHEDNW
jgi:hypothetical protein